MKEAMLKQNIEKKAVLNSEIYFLLLREVFCQKVLDFFFGRTRQE